MLTPKPANGICSTVLLLLITTLAMASIPSATSQQFTTSTSWVTGTNIGYTIVQTQSSTYDYESSFTVTSMSNGTTTLIGFLSESTITPTLHFPTPCYTFLTGAFDYVGPKLHIHYEAAQPTYWHILDSSDVSYVSQHSCTAE